MTVRQSELLSMMDQITPDDKEIKFRHPERKPENLSKDALLQRFFKMSNLASDIFTNLPKYFEEDWNFVDIGVLLLGSEQLEQKLFPKHSSGKTYLNRDNAIVDFSINKAKKWMNDNDVILIDGKSYSRSVVDARGFA